MTNESQGSWRRSPIPKSEFTAIMRKAARGCGYKKLPKIRFVTKMKHGATWAVPTGISFRRGPDEAVWKVLSPVEPEVLLHSGFVCVASRHRWGFDADRMRAKWALVARLWRAWIHTVVPKAEFPLKDQTECLVAADWMEEQGHDEPLMTAFLRGNQWWQDSFGPTW